MGLALFGIVCIDCKIKELGRVAVLVKSGACAFIIFCWI